MRLRDDQDAFGHALLDRYRGLEGHEIVERDDGHIGAIDAGALYFAPFRRWPAHERRALRLARGRVLDVGCGAGRVALHLQARGLRVVAIDISPMAVRVTRLRGVRQARVVAAADVDPKLGRFETIVMYGNNLGLLGGERSGRRMLRRFAAIATPHARILASATDPYTTSDPHHRAYHRRNRARGRMGGQIRLRIRYDMRATPWFDYLLASREELAALVEGTGWSLERTIDGSHGRYVAVLRAPRDR